MKPLMQQEWHNLLFAHWACDPELLQRMLPHGLELDTYRNDAYVGVVPFTLHLHKIRLLPSLLVKRNFHELNVRTYVRFRGMPGVYFFSLDASNLTSVLWARNLYRLNYRYAHIRLNQRGSQTFELQSKLCNRSNEGSFYAIYGNTGQPIAEQKNDLLSFLTERYCFFSSNGKHLYKGTLQHAPWTFTEGFLYEHHGNLLQHHGIIIDRNPPLLAFSTRVDVDILKFEKL